MKALGPWLACALLIALPRTDGAEPSRPTVGPKEVFTSRVLIRPVGGPVGGVREYFDDRGLVERRIYYRARVEIGETTEHGTPYSTHPSDERTAVPMEIYDFWNDEQRRRTRRERSIVGRGLDSILVFQYDDDEATTTERFTGDGALLSRRIHGGGTAGYTMLHFTPDGATPVGVEGVVPGLPQFDWGPTRDGLSCAAVVTPRSGPIERIVIHVSLLNRSEDTLPIGWGPASVEARPSLFDADGRQVPIPPAIREAQRLEQEANGGLRFGSAIAPGSARYSRHRLATWYPELPPGDYRLVLERVGQGVGQFVRCPGLEWTVEASAR